MKILTQYHSKYYFPELGKYHYHKSLNFHNSISQFRKDYLTFIKKEKGKALRKKVMEKSKKSVKKLDINFILNDDSENKNASHYRLKSELAVNKELLSSSSFTKNSLLLIQICGCNSNIMSIFSTSCTHMS
jgi:hypothetical protein